MRKILLTITLLLMLITDTYAQITADDANGQSTIVYKATSISLNITDAAVKQKNNLTTLGSKGL